MIAKVSALVLLFFSLATYAQNSSQEFGQQNQADDLERHLSAAETFQISGDLVNAAVENRAIAAVGLQRFGNVLIEEGKYQDSVKMLTESRSYADNARIRIDLAVAYLRLGQVNEALEEARTAVSLSPDNAYARFILGNIYFTRENYQMALPELEKVIILEPNFDAARALGLTYLYLKQLERAKLLFEEMQASLQKDSSQLHILFGQAYEQTGYALEAEREFKRAVEIDPKQLRASFYLGYVILRHGGSERIPEAAAAFERELKLTPDDFYSNLFAGVTASSENNHKEALGYLQKAVRLNSKSGEAYLFLGQTQLELSDLAEAEKSLRRAAALEESDAKARYQSRRTHFLLGRLLLRTGRKDEAEKELAIAKKLQLASLDSARDEINRILGQVIGENGNAAGKAGVEVGPADDAVSQARLAELKKIKLYLGDILAQAFHNLGVIAVQNDRPEEALEKFAAAYAWKPDFPGLDRNWGIAGFNARKFEQAVGPLARRLMSNPGDVLVRRMLGASYYFTGDYPKTIETLLPIRVSLAKSPELAYFYGIALIQQKRSKEAANFFNQLAKEAQTDPEALNYSAQGFMYLGDYVRAAEGFDAVLALAPNTSKASFFKGQCLIRLNRFEESERSFREELKLNPLDESSKYHLALTLIERKTSIDEAILILQDAIRLKPDYADAHYQLGKIYIERGETEKAIEQLEAAVQSGGEKDYIHYQLSIAYRKASRIDDAARELKAYQKLKSESRKNETPMGEQ